MSFTTESHATKRTNSEAFASSEKLTTPTKHPRLSEDTQDENDINWVFDLDYSIAENADSYEEDSYEEASPRSIPDKYIRMLDERVGSSVFPNRTVQDMHIRRTRLRCVFLNIIRALAKLASDDSTIRWPSNQKPSSSILFSAGFGRLFRTEDPDWLVDHLMSGIPDSTIFAFGASEFSLDDILQLPLLPNAILSEKSVYVDCLKYSSREEDETWWLYVGSATGQWGCLQRWNDYYKGRCSTRHGQASCDPSSTMNLRCLAHYGLSPSSFLPNFAEGMFMVLLGTVNKPVNLTNCSYTHAGLYEAFEGVRSDLNLAPPLAKGLNSTWVFSQGWKRLGPTPGSKCISCQRVVPPRNDPSYNTTHWRYIDPIRPSSKYIKCLNCTVYERRTCGKERPKELEEVRERHPRSKPTHTKPTHTKPDTCEWPDCTNKIQRFCGPKNLYLCTTHIRWVALGKDMDTLSEPKLRAKPTHTKPDTCEWLGCIQEAWQFCSAKMMYLCTTHYGRVSRGCSDEEMNAPKYLKMRTPKQAAPVTVQEKEVGRVVQPQSQPKTQPQPRSQPQSQSWPNIPSPITQPSAELQLQLQQIRRPVSAACLVLARVHHPGKDFAALQATVVQNGYEIARRWAENRTEPIQFSTVMSQCHCRRNELSTNWHTDGNNLSDMALDQRSWFQKVTETRITVVIRGIDGLVCDKSSFMSFLRMMIELQKEVYVVFQSNVSQLNQHTWIDSYLPSPGLGFVLTFWANDFLAHLEGVRQVDSVDRVLEVWKYISVDTKSQRPRSRNCLPA